MRGLCFAGLLLFLACDSEPDFGERRVDPACLPFSATRTFVLAEIPDVQLVDGTWVAAGFNVDGSLTTTTDIEGCQVPDFIDLDRDLRGVDNQLASAKSTLGTYAGVDSDITVPASNTTFEVEISPRDDTDHRGCLAVTMRTASSTHEGFGTMTEGGRVVAGLEGTWAPENLFGWEEVWQIERLHLVVDPELEEVVVAGSQTIDAWLDVLEPLFDEYGLETVHSTLESLADLDPAADGVCQSVSLGFIAEPL